MLNRVYHPLEADEHYLEEGCFILECWNRPADPAVSIARARVPPGETTRWHRLSGITERYVILSGQGRVELGQQEPALVSSGDVVIIPAGERQRITNLGETDLLFYAICTPRFLPSCYEDLESVHNPRAPRE